jgi:hypothetical protein
MKPDYNELKSILAGALISVAGFLGLAQCEGSPNDEAPPHLGARHREYCEYYCGDADAVLYEVENVRGNPVCHCAIPDPE